MKVGDLVRVKNDPEGWLGHGVVLAVNGMREVQVHWFDDFADAPVDWNATWTLEILSEVTYR
jgi:hypothetical protein